MKFQPIALAFLLALGIAVFAGCDRPAAPVPPPVSVQSPDSEAQSEGQSAGAQSHPAVDKAAEDEALTPPPPFDGWANPVVALAITGQQLGYIEPCGCTGLENQKGGLARRFTLLKQLRDDKGWPVVALDVGSQVKRFGKQSEIKFQRTAEGLRAMDYKAAALGAEDLRLSAGE
jgi:hypothetical protein